MQKRKNAESIQKENIERRTKQRVDEFEESEKKIFKNFIVSLCIHLNFFYVYDFNYYLQANEDMNLKEKYRSEMLEDLKNIDDSSYDMGSLLRGLGYKVGYEFAEVSLNFSVL